MADKNGAVKTSGYSDLPSSELRAKRLGKSDKRKLQKKKELTQKYFVPSGAEDVFDKQAKDYTTKLDEKSILRNKDIDLNNLSDFYKGLNYNDIVPLMDSNLPQNEGSMLLMSKLNNLKNFLGSYSTGMHTADLGNGMKFGVEGRHTTEVGLKKQPFELPEIKIGNEPTAEEKKNGVAGRIQLGLTGNEEFALHSHDDNSLPSNQDLLTAGYMPNVKNSYILSNDGLLEYGSEKVDPKLINSVDYNVRDNQETTNLPFSNRRKLIKKMITDRGL